MVVLMLRWEKVCGWEESGGKVIGGQMSCGQSLGVGGGSVGYESGGGESVGRESDVERSCGQQRGGPLIGDQ
ncbi:hypothetical protein F2Q70_00007020 [Brassica cretica]|uniref:Uncharacterized protein n=1 Tax=Brassica cretica TaxID=69181 RepID=A0A8S9M261_BRACR|nr:hypothetical protein F2Q70_00007020 [Brassica cretica]